MYLKTNLFIGTYLQITGVLATNGGILSEPFTPAFSFCADPNDENHRLAVAMCLAALRESLVALDQHYKDLEYKDDLPSSESVFPYKTSFISLAGNLVNFKYIGRPFDHILLFLAETADDNVLAIKYTRQYSLDAHQILSDEGLAPELHGFESIPGGWKMVVMQCMGESYQLLSQLEPENRERFKDSIQQGVSLLHKHGFVHGDLRPSNVLVSKREPKALIIDFDAAGEADKVVYPPHLNTIDILWPKDVKDGIPVTKAHDNYMLDRLFTSKPTRSRREESAKASKPRRLRRKELAKASKPRRSRRKELARGV
jgi:serine/threonine protein kinase